MKNLLKKSFHCGETVLLLYKIKGVSGNLKTSSRSHPSLDPKLGNRSGEAMKQ
jgi:hypothetical protein